MGDKEEIEKIARYILPIPEGKTWVTWDTALEIAKDMYADGYRKIPELPMLSDEEIDCETPAYADQKIMNLLQEQSHRIAQAQLDLIRRKLNG